MTNTTRTRIAPSPTGFFHIGTARTALFNYLFAKKNKGRFILRIEDTDLERSDEKYTDDILEGLRWLGLDWDEFYRQSANLESHKKYLQKLLDENKAFFCFHTKEQLEQESQNQSKNKEAPRHICGHKDKKVKESNGSQSIIRLKGSLEKIIFKDLIRGEIEFNAELLGDISLAKNLNAPLYNFAVVVDDYETKISHIIRGEDHISNTPKQILIQRALGFNRPQYAHLPLILSPDKSKLSKRFGAVSLREYREAGYLPEAIINFMAFLGWNPGDDREILSLEELVKEFSLEKTHKSGAVFNKEKLDWLNSEYIKAANIDYLYNLSLPFFKNVDYKISEDKLKKVLLLEKERIKTLAELPQAISFFFQKPILNKEIICWKNQSLKEANANLKEIYNIIDNMRDEDFNQFQIKEKLMPMADKKGKGEVLWPFRVALSGRKASPGPFEIVEILGKKETLQRIQNVFNLGNNP